MLKPVLFRDIKNRYLRSEFIKLNFYPREIDILKYRFLKICLGVNVLYKFILKVLKKIYII